jgi:outer membrane protein assembly factor BamB
MGYQGSAIWRRIASLILVVLQCYFILESFSNSVAAEAENQATLSQPLIVKWLYPADTTTNLTPATDGERLYLPLSSGLLISLNAPNGQLNWKTEIGGEVSSSPVADQRGVYVASEIVGVEKSAPHTNGALRALGRDGGITLWRRTLPMPLQGGLIADGAKLYGGSSDGRVYAIKKETGDIVWTMQHSAPFASQPSIFGNRLYIGSDDGNLFAIDKSTGQVAWRYQTQGAIHGTAVVVEGLVFFGSTDGYVYALKESDGSLRWRRRTGASVQTVANAQSGLLVVSLDNYVYCLSYGNGDSLWKRQLAGRVASAPLTADDGALFTPLSSSFGVVLDLHNGKQINTLPLDEENSITASPVVAGKMLFITTRHGLLAFSRPN